MSCASDSLSELETDIKVFKDSLLKILDEDEIIEELCLTKWTDPRVLYVTHSHILPRAVLFNTLLQSLGEVEIQRYKRQWYPEYSP